MTASVGAAAELTWHTDPPAALEQAQQTGRLVLIRFTADWCGYCRKMERTTFADPVMTQAVQEDFVPLVIDVDAYPDAARKLQIRGLPTMLIVTPDMKIVRKITGYQSTERLLPQLKQVAAAERRPVPGIAAMPAVQERPAPASDLTAGSAEHSPTTPGPVSPASVREIPSAAPRTVSFEGLCLTSAVDEHRLVRGSSEFQAEHRGHIIWFAGPDQKQRFIENPDRYWPVHDGLCIVSLVDRQQRVPGKLQHAAVFRDRIWLFSSQEDMTAFIADAARFADQAAERMNEEPKEGF